MSKKDAKQFFEILEKDTSFQFQIANSRSESECLQLIHNHHLLFDEKEFRSAFEEKYHRPLKKEELYKLETSKLLPSGIAAKLPYIHNQPKHGE